MAERLYNNRNMIVRASNSDDKSIENYMKKENKKIENLKKVIVENETRSKVRKDLLKTLNEESKYWLSNQDFNVSKNLTLIPNNFENQSDYFIKLQEVNLTESTKGLRL